MESHLDRSLKLVTMVSVLVVGTLVSIATENPTTFELTASLPAATIHVGDDLVLDVITSNPTDHVVYAGEGAGAGLAVELLNGKGDDIGLHAMGIPGGKIQQPEATFMTSRRAFRPGSKEHFTWRFKPEPGYLLPGAYKLRVYQRDMKSKLDVYSNQVVITVVP
jgi:hypothetical protein